MANMPPNTSLSRDWRIGAAIGAAIGIAVPTVTEVRTALEPSMGYWPALLVGAVAAGAVGGGVALLIQWFSRWILRRRDRS
jgi:hypothetical protein